MKRLLVSAAVLPLVPAAAHAETKITTATTTPVATSSLANGQPDDLLIDTAAMKVRYLDVDLADDVAGEDPDRHILVPIGYARLDEEEDHVFVDSLDREQLRGMPVYDHGSLTREYETDVRRRFDRTFTAASPERDFYASDLYDADRFYGSRRNPGGNPLA